MASSSNLFTFFVSLVKFSYCCKFHVNMITASGVMTISFYEGLTRNAGSRNTPLWVLPIIRRLGRDWCYWLCYFTMLSANVSYYLNLKIKRNKSFKCNISFNSQNLKTKRNKSCKFNTPLAIRIWRQNVINLANVTFHITEECWETLK